MLPMTVREIETAVHGVWWNPREDAPAVSAVCTDSRDLVPGCLFVPWKGENFDGHDFIDKALESGAAGALCTRLPADLRPDRFYIKVDDTRLALKALASAYRDRFDIPFVQITGSVGKTTTKEMIAAVLSAGLNILKTPENFNNDIGTPLTMFQLMPEHQAAVIETGMRRTVAPLQPFKTKKPLANYKLVILGTPVWAGRCSSVIRGFLKEQGYLLTNVSYVLLRSGNGKCEEVYQQMDKYLSQPHRTAVSLRAGSVGYRFWQEEFLRRTRAFLEGEEIQD